MARATSCAVAAGVLAFAAGWPALVAAQQTDSTRAGAESPRPRPRGAPTAPRDSLAQPPISPRRAFLYSALLPGLGQAKLDRPNAGILFVGVELVSVVMASRTAANLSYARRHARDSVVESFRQEGDSMVPIFARNRYDPNRVRSRRTQYEDWIAALVFNHLISGADAFVAAQLWDLPGQVTFRAGPGAAALTARVAW